MNKPLSYRRHSNKTVFFDVINAVLNCEIVTNVCVLMFMVILKGHSGFDCFVNRNLLLKVKR